MSFVVPFFSSQSESSPTRRRKSDGGTASVPIHPSFLHRIVAPAEVTVKIGLDERPWFPRDFAFQLTRKEFANLKCQIGSSSSAWGGRRTLTWAFTEQCVAMLSSVLRSRQAVVVNIEAMRAFVRLREMMGSHAELARRLDELERRFRENDGQFVVVFDAFSNAAGQRWQKAERSAGRASGIPSALFERYDCDQQADDSPSRAD